MFTTLLIVLACLVSEASATNLRIVEPRARVFFIGDLHGDANATWAIFQNIQERYQAMPIPHGTCSFGDILCFKVFLHAHPYYSLVQVGDVLDRGPDALKIVNWFDQLTHMPDITGDRRQTFVVAGNHEVKHVEKFASIEKDKRPPYLHFLENLPLGYLLKIPDIHNNFWHRPIIAIHASMTVANIEMLYKTDLHGYASHCRNTGVLARHAAALGMYANYNEGAYRPFFNRTFGRGQDCDVVREVLDRTNASMIVVGHTVNGHHVPLSYCDGMVWNVDTGISDTVAGFRSYLMYDLDAGTPVAHAVRGGAEKKSIKLPRGEL